MLLNLLVLFYVSQPYIFFSFFFHQGIAKKHILLFCPQTPPQDPCVLNLVLQMAQRLNPFCVIPCALIPKRYICIFRLVNNSVFLVWVLKPVVRFFLLSSYIYYPSAFSCHRALPWSRLTQESEISLAGICSFLLFT